MAAGPLRGFRFIEFAGIGPGPFCAMLLADLGADIIRVDRKDLVGTEADAGDVLARGRRSIALDLKDEKDNNELSEAMIDDLSKLLKEAEYQGKKVQLNKPKN